MPSVQEIPSSRFCSALELANLGQTKARNGTQMWIGCFAISSPHFRGLGSGAHRSQGLENHRCGSWNVSHPSSLVEFLNEGIKCSSKIKIEGGKFRLSQKSAAELLRGGGPWAEETQFCRPQKTQAECCRWWKLEELSDTKPEDYDHLWLNLAN